MKQVLLAIDGKYPTQSAFQYAAELSREIKAELSILQFLKEKKIKECFLSAKLKVKKIGRLLENSFADVALAEECSPDKSTNTAAESTAPLFKLLARHKNIAPYGLSFSGGNPETELQQFIDKHKDIVLIVFDASEDNRKASGYTPADIKKIKNNVNIPLVVMKS